MCNDVKRLVNIPVAVVDGLIQVAYRPHAVKECIDDMPTSEKAKSYTEIVDMFVKMVQGWDVTEVKETRFRGRVVETRHPVQVTRTRLMAEPQVPGFLLMHVMVAVVADWAANGGNGCADCAQDGAIVAVKEDTNG